MDFLTQVGYPLIAGLTVAGIIWGMSVWLEKKKQKKQVKSMDETLYEDE